MKLVHHWSNHEKLQCISAWSSIPCIDSKSEVCLQCKLYNMSPSIAHWLHTPGPLSISKCLLHRISTGWPWPLLLSIVVCLLFFQRLRVFYLCKSIVDQGLFPRPPFYWADRVQAIKYCLGPLSPSFCFTIPLTISFFGHWWVLESKLDEKQMPH